MSPPSTTRKRPRTALLLVSDKTGIVEFAGALKGLGFTLLSAGSTAKTLKQAELLVEETTILPLHPELLSKLLADPSDPLARRALDDSEGGPIELVAVNLYPLAEVVSGGPVDQPEVMKFLDVVPFALLRAAARNFEHITPLCDPGDYGKVLDSIQEFGEVPRETRRALSAKAFFYTAYYDSTVAQFLTDKADPLPEELVMGLKKNRDIPYGENPHQRAALYTLAGSRPWGLAAARGVHGRELQFNQYLDLESGLELVAEFQEPACAIFRHTQPCGAAAAERPAEALRQAFRTDPQACAAGAAAFNREVDEEAAKVLAELQLECVAAREFSQPALSILRLKKDLRLVVVPSGLLFPYEMTFYAVSGGLLVEDKDNKTLAGLNPVTQRTPSPSELLALEFAWKVAKHAKTYAAVLAKGTHAVGIGSGQPTRLDALRVAIGKSNEHHPILKPETPLVLASDGPLSLRSIHEAAAIGVSAIVQSGGTSEDASCIQVCDQHHLSMTFTGLRHYKH